MRNLGRFIANDVRVVGSRSSLLPRVIFMGAPLSQIVSVFQELRRQFTERLRGYWKRITTVHQQVCCLPRGMILCESSSYFLKGLPKISK